MQSVNLDDHSTAVFDSNITHIDINNTINTEANTSSTRRTRKLPSIFGYIIIYIFNYFKKKKIFIFNYYLFFINTII